MSSTLIISLALPWLIWGVLMVLLMIANRSWIGLILPPLGTTIVLLAVAHLASVREAFWFSLSLHLALLLFFLASYLRFRSQQRNNREG